MNVPQRWTIAKGASWLAATPKMLATAGALRGSQAVMLARDVPVGDAACACAGVDAATPVHLPYVPQLRVGGSGTSAPTDASNFAANAPSLADTGFFEALPGPPDPTTTTMDAQDMETAAVARVARRYHVPFLGIRAVSDGQGDPLNLPGFPWQFFVYRQLAGNNAATVTMAFLSAWATKGRPVQAQRVVRLIRGVAIAGRGAGLGTLGVVEPPLQRGRRPEQPDRPCGHRADDRHHPDCEAEGTVETHRGGLARAPSC